MRVDLELRGGLVVDGTGRPGFTANVYISKNKIVAVQPPNGANDCADFEPDEVVVCTGLCVCPGFIDIHTHSDFSVLGNARMTSSLMQGVTTEVVGNCGVSVCVMKDLPVFAQEQRWIHKNGAELSWASVSEWYRRVEDQGFACNIATLVGHGTVRKTVLGTECRPPDTKELLAMQQIIGDALDQGAVGFSTGLEYLPGGYADIAEQTALASVMCGSNKFYSTHIRNEGDTLVESVDEAIQVARSAGVPLQLSHHKCEGHRNWGKVTTTLAMMAAAREEGLDVLTDQYPYDAYMTGLTVILLPKWANAGTQADIVNRLLTPSERALIRGEVLEKQLEWGALEIGTTRNRREVQGVTLADLANHDGKDAIDAALDLIVSEEGAVSAIYHAMCETDIRAVLRDEHTMIGSDGVAQTPDGPMSEDHTHPRTYGTFPRVFARYVGSCNLLSFEEAVRKATSLPARRIGLRDRGTIGTGMKADIAIVDAQSFGDTATFSTPQSLPSGLHHVLVNGRFAVKNSKQTGELAGAILRS